MCVGVCVLDPLSMLVGCVVLQAVVLKFYLFSVQNSNYLIQKSFTPFLIDD